MKKYPITKQIKALFDKKSSNEMSMSQFVEACLYSDFGYYKQNRQRIGFSKQNDFYTASSLGKSKLLANLIKESFENILISKGENPKEYTLCEIAAENGGIFKDKGVFKTLKNYELGKELVFEGKNVIFANELLDAFSFNSYIYKSKKWYKIYVKEENSYIYETYKELDENDFFYKRDKNIFQDKSVEDQRIDLSEKMYLFLENFINQNWQGIAVFADYGKYFADMIFENPNGTARGYKNHKLVPCILENASQMDITIDVCWDLCLSFKGTKLISQESFFMNNAQKQLQNIFDNGSFTQKSSAMELLSPRQMGERFKFLVIEKL